MPGVLWRQKIIMQNNSYKYTLLQKSTVFVALAIFVATVAFFWRNPYALAALTLSGNVKFLKTLDVQGALTKGSGTFVIDHPLDPKNKVLFHSFVESPDVKNIYDGIATLDDKGEAVISLPDYFDALNKDVRYQVKPLGAPMPNLYIKKEEHNNQFTVGGGSAGGKVSWQITGIRKDPYILAHPIIPEVLKGPGQIVNQGECIFEPLCE